jgi:zinc transport system permease protein
MLEFQFFRLALIGVAILSVAAAIIGTYVITRRMVAIAGGVTHACFGGLGLGYFLGINPVIMAGVFAIASSLGVEWMSTRFKVRTDSANAVIWAIGMAIGVFFVFMTPGYVPELNSFLFGNILTVSTGDIIAFAVYTLLLVAFFLWRFDEIVACAFDRDFARVIGLKVNFITTVMTVMVAICIVLTIRLVGVMLLMSMLSLPMMIAEVWFHRFKSLLFVSAGVSLFCCVLGLYLGTLIDVPTSALIVMIMAALFILSRVVKTLKR